MLYVNACDGDQLGVLLFASQEWVEWMLSGLETAREVEGGNRRL